jgi:pyruvate-ferredoxin/flavodoxin oxidoreductase
VAQAQNPDVFFQAREAANPFYDNCAEIVERSMKRLAELTGRQYNLFDYEGDSSAERVIVNYGVGAETVHETVEELMRSGEKVGRPQSQTLPSIFSNGFSGNAAEDDAPDRRARSNERAGAPGDPLYLDVMTALGEARTGPNPPFAIEPLVIAGRYGLSSKEFTPAMVKSVFDELGKESPAAPLHSGNHR